MLWFLSLTVWHSLVRWYRFYLLLLLAVQDIVYLIFLNGHMTCKWFSDCPCVKDFLGGPSHMSWCWMVFLGRSGAYIPPESGRNLRSAPKSGGYGSIEFSMALLCTLFPILLYVNLLSEEDKWPYFQFFNCSRKPTILTTGFNWIYEVFHHWCFVLKFQGIMPHILVQDFLELWKNGGS